MLLQDGSAIPSSTTWELIQHSSPETRVVLVITAIFSIASWFIIGFKWWRFRQIKSQAARFFNELERTTRLKDAYHAVMKLPPSPYNRLFREGLNFVTELRPGAMRDEGKEHQALSATQLEALKMVLYKEVAAERDLVARNIPWLATFGSVGPLLGLLGTVLGVMNAFVGIASKGSGNISAVAPGIAEALIATVAGLAAAIPAVIAYNIFVSKVGMFASELEGFANELVGTMAREGLI